MKINRVHISDIIDARRMDPIFFRYGTMQFGRYFRLEAISTCIVDIQSGVGAGKRIKQTKTMASSKFGLQILTGMEC